MSNCPHCGNRIEISISADHSQNAIHTRPKVGKVTLESSHHSPLRNEAAAINLPANYAAESRSASFMPTTESNVKVPLMQSLISGILIGLPVGIVVGFIDIKLGPAVLRGDIMAGLVWGMTITFGVAFWQWFGRIQDYNELLWRIESVTGLDVNNDDAIGKPEPRTVRVEVQEGKGWKFSELPGDEQALYDFALSVVKGVVTFSERGAASRDYGAENFRRLREAFIQRHYAEWKDPDNHQLGVVLRRSGTAVLAAIAKEPPPAEMAGSDDDGMMSGNYVERGSKRESWG